METVKSQQVITEIGHLEKKKTILRNDHGPPAIPYIKDREQPSFALKKFANQWGKQMRVS